jgi:hypothetical protein
MAYSVFSFTSRANPNLLAERMYREQFKRNKFAQWVAPNFIRATRGTEEVIAPLPDGPRWTGAPIEVHEEFVRMGRTTLDIPVRNRLYEDPVDGDKALLGTAERARITVRTVRINYTRKAYAPPTGMSLQIVKKYADNLVEQADSYLRTWWNDYHPGNFILTLCAGYSKDLLAPTTEGGRAQTIMSHPNFFTAGAGQVTWASGRPGTAGYEGAVESALNGLSDTASDKMSPDLIENLVLEAGRAKIAPIVTKDGFEFYPIWINDSQWSQLRNHADFKDWMKRLPVGLTNNPLGNNAEAYIAGGAIYTDPNLFAAYTNAIDSNVTAGLPEYGPRPTAAGYNLGYQVGNTITQFDTGNLRMGLLVGASCMSVGVGERMDFTEEISDHGFLKEIGIATIQSVVRSDIFDQDGLVAGLSAGDFYQNTGSLAFATYSPYALAWS